MAYYLEKDFFEDVDMFSMVQKVMQGNLTLRWFNANTEHVRLFPKDGHRGLTYEDCNVGSYSYDHMPEVIRNNYSMAPRGSELWGKLPDLGYTVNRKSDVWSDNVAALYEEAKTRRWAPAIDVSWETLTKAPLSESTEAAMAQLCTFLQECATVVMAVSSQWIYWINQEFLELKSYLCAQILDQARHIEAFRKRALAGGQGLKRASVSAEQALKEILSASTYVEASLGGNLMLGSFLLAVYRQVATVATSPADRQLFTFAIQDAARLVSYGSGHLRYHLAHLPHQQATLHGYLDSVEHCFLGLLGSPECMEPLVILSGGGTAPAELQKGTERVSRFLLQTADEYLERCERAGLSGRTERSRLSQYLKQLAV